MGKKCCIGILAHVDAGKTTFTEQLLYNTGSIAAPGRVDDKTSSMDTHEIEQARGITIFADQGYFKYGQNEYYIIDTPGHMDFTAETERAVSVLDYAILVLDGSCGVQAHTSTLFQLLEWYDVPVFCFLNKMDKEGADVESVLGQIKERLSEDVLYLSDITMIEEKNEAIAEYAAERDEIYMEHYLEGTDSPEELMTVLQKLIKKRECMLAMSGSVLKGEGVDAFLQAFDLLTKTDYKEKEQETMEGKVFKIRHDEKGQPIVFMKLLAGSVQPRDAFSFVVEKDGEIEKTVEKVQELRRYQGNQFERLTQALAGDVIAVTGLKTPQCGQRLRPETKWKLQEYYMMPPLQAKVCIEDGTDSQVCYERLRLLEKEEPALAVTYEREKKQLLVHIMGKIQLEVLQQLMQQRFNIAVHFENPEVQYRETIRDTVIGIGHYEPLRHYAEVQIRLEPAERGCGITFSSECHVDTLALNWQRLIETHIFEKEHKGILTGSPITDIHIVLQNGRSHLKHTCGGDFRESTYRAVRQGLEKADSVLLEPYYRFEIAVEEEYLGKVMSDIQVKNGMMEPPEQREHSVCMRGRGPVRSFMDYSTELLSFTKGTGSISCLFDGYDICTQQEEIVEAIGYNKDADLENPSSSVFCAKGAGFVVKWDEVDAYAHTNK